MGLALSTKSNFQGVHDFPLSQIFMGSTPSRPNLSSQEGEASLNLSSHGLDTPPSLLLVGLALSHNSPVTFILGFPIAGCSGWFIWPQPFLYVIMTLSLIVYM